MVMHARYQVCFTCFWRCLTILILLFVCHSTATAADASIKLNSETNSIFLGDLVILDIESRGLHEPLDVSQLKNANDFVRETVGTRIAVQDGNVVDIAIRRMEFIPSREGIFYYGPLRGEGTQGSVLSNSIVVEVKPALNEQWSPGPNDFTGDIRLSTQSPRLGQQITMDIMLRHQYPIANELITPPGLKQFDVINLFNQRRTVVEENGKTWRQTAWRYLLYPKQSGSVSIDAISWSGTMIKSRTQRGEFELSLPPLALKVKPSTSQAGEWWLPATNVALSDAWSKEVRTLSAGDEIIRTITLVADDVMANQLPDVEPLASRAISSTLIRAHRHHEIVNNRSVATAIFEFRMIAQSPIPVFLDTVRVPWWNTVTNSAEEAIIPARRINVGLPDRKDLLADLALSGSRVDIMLGTLRSFARWQPILIVALATTVLMLSIKPGLHIWRYANQRVRLRKQHERLVALHKQHRWQELYSEIDSLERYGSLHPQYQRLKALLQEKLFGRITANSGKQTDEQSDALHHFKLPKIKAVREKAQYERPVSLL